MEHRELRIARNPVTGSSVVPGPGVLSSRLWLPFSLLAAALFLSACSSRPPEQLFKEDIRKMVLIDRELGFKEEITGIEIVKRRKYEDQQEVQVRVTGWAVHPELTIGATLPSYGNKRPSWAFWKYFCRKIDGQWVIEEKYKVQEGFSEEKGSESRIQNPGEETHSTG